MCVTTFTFSLAPYISSNMLTILFPTSPRTLTYQPRVIRLQQEALSGEYYELGASPTFLSIFDLNLRPSEVTSLAHFSQTILFESGSETSALARKASLGCFSKCSRELVDAICLIKCHSHPSDTSSVSKVRGYVRKETCKNQRKGTLLLLISFTCRFVFQLSYLRSPLISTFALP